MSSSYSTVGFICRVEPPHLGHLQVIKHALTRTNDLRILIGSAKSASNIENPFSYEARVILLEKMLAAELSKADLSKITFHPVRDHLYHQDRWEIDVQKIMGMDGVAIISSNKDDDDVQRRGWLPYYEHISVPLGERIDASSIRLAIYEGRPEDARRFLHPTVADDVLTAPVWPRLIAEYAAIQNRTLDERELRAAGKLKHPIVRNTADAVVFCAGHVLVVRRGGKIGNGLLATPGGYLDEKDTVLMDCALRELDEETNIDVPPRILQSNIQFSQEFSHKKRSKIARVVTQAFCIHLPAQLRGDKGAVRNTGGLPKVKAGDDAAEAFWLPLSKLEDLEDQFFDDHWHIITTFHSRLERSLYK